MSVNKPLAGYKAAGDFASSLDIAVVDQTAVGLTIEIAVDASDSVAVIRMSKWHFEQLVYQALDTLAKM